VEKEMETVKLFREMNQVVAAIIAVAADGDERKEVALVNGYSRVLDRVYDKAREHRYARPAA
jgi:hypothetical protein